MKGTIAMDWKQFLARIFSSHVAKIKVLVVENHYLT